MNIKSSLILFFLISVSITGMCQAFRPGYIITHEFDTISGLIKYTGGNKTAKNCLFKVSEDSNLIDYKPTDIHAYRLNEGKFFISMEVDKEFYFLEYLIKGSANMYYYSDKDGPHYFVETEGSGFFELTEPDRIFETDTGTYQLPARYPMMLAVSFNEMKGINERVADVKLTHNSLISLAKDYHDYVCDSVECIIFEAMIKPIRFHVGVIGGLTFNHLNFGRKVKSGFHPGFEFGGFMTIHNLLISSERFFFRLALSFQHQNKFRFTNTGRNSGSTLITYNDIIYYLNPKTDYEIDDIHTLKTELDADLKLWFLKIPLTLNYNISMGKIKSFIGGGAVTLFTLSQNEDFQYHDLLEAYGQSIPSFLFGYKFQSGLIRELKGQGSLFGEVSFEQLMNLGGLHDYQRLYTMVIGVRLGYTF